MGKLSDIKPIQSMSELDKFIVIVNGTEHLISKENLQKIFSGLTSDQHSKLSKIILSGDGTKLLSDNGNYIDVVNLFNNNQFEKNKGKVELKDYHTHSNLVDVLDKFTVGENNALLFDGEEINSYSLPVATENTLGGVKIDGDTIKINDGVISVDVIGNWTSGVNYPVGYFAVYDGKLHQCIRTNSDTEWDEHNWSLIKCGSSIGITEWQSNVEYIVNTVVIYENTLYKCNETHISATEFDTTKWVGLTGGKGDKGDRGEDGISPNISLVATSTGVNISVTDIDGVHDIEILNGADGINGKSAYEIAIDDGFKGSEQEWIKSLKGENGITPTIDCETKHWFIGDVDTGILAEAKLTSELGQNFVTKTEFDELYNMVNSANNILEKVLSGEVDIYG